MSQNDDPLTSKVEAVMARIRTDLMQKRSRSDLATRLTETSSSHGNLFAADVYGSLHQARTIGGGIGVTYALGWRTPVVGQAWMLVRQRIHQEIRIYIDTLTSQQTNLNTHFIRALTGVVEGLDSLGLRNMRQQQLDQDAALKLLQAEVNQLRLDIQALRAVHAPDDDPRPSDAASRS